MTGSTGSNATGTYGSGDNRWAFFGIKDGAWVWLGTASMNNSSVNTSKSTYFLTPTATTIHQTSPPVSSSRKCNDFPFMTSKVDFYQSYRLKHIQVGDSNKIYTGGSGVLYVGTDNLWELEFY